MPKYYNHFYWNGEFTSEVVNSLKKWNIFLAKQSNVWGTILWTSAALIQKEPSTLGLHYKQLTDEEKTANKLEQAVDYYFLEKRQKDGSTLPLGIAANVDQLIRTYQLTYPYLFELYEALLVNQHYAFVADIVRLVVLNTSRGLYLDVDVEPSSQAFPPNFDKINQAFVEKGLGSLKFAIAVQERIDETNTLLSLEEGAFTEVLKHCDAYCQKSLEALRREIEMLAEQRRETKKFFNIRRPLSLLFKKYALIFSKSVTPDEQSIVLRVLQTVDELADLSHLLAPCIEYKLLDPFDQTMIVSTISRSTLARYLTLEESQIFLKKLTSEDSDIAPYLQEKIKKLLADCVFIPNRDLDLYLHAYTEKNTEQFIKLNQDQEVYFVDLLTALQRPYEITINTFHESLQPELKRPGYDPAVRQPNDFYEGKNFARYLTNYQELLGQYRETEQDGLHLYSWGNPGFSYLRKTLPAIKKIQRFYLEHRFLTATGDVKEREKERKIQWFIQDLERTKQGLQNAHLQAETKRKRYEANRDQSKEGSVQKEMHDARRMQFQGITKALTTRLNALNECQQALECRLPNDKSIKIKPQFFEAVNILDKVKTAEIILCPFTFPLYPFHKLELKTFLDDNANRLIKDLRRSFQEEKRLRMSEKEVKTLIESLLRAVMNEIDKHKLLEDYEGSFDTSEIFTEKKKILIVSTLRFYCLRNLKRMVMPYFQKEGVQSKPHLRIQSMNETTFHVVMITDESLSYRIKTSNGESCIKEMPLYICEEIIERVCAEAEKMELRAREEKYLMLIQEKQVELLQDVFSLPEVDFYLKSYLQETGEMETELSQFLEELYTLVVNEKKTMDTPHNESFII